MTNISIRTLQFGLPLLIVISVVERLMLITTSWHIHWHHVAEGLAGGLLYALLIAWEQRNFLKGMLFSTSTREQVLREAKAKVITSRYQLRGKLIMTSQRLIFIPGTNRYHQAPPLILDLVQIDDQQQYRSWWRVTTRLQVTLINQDQYTFMIDDTFNWSYALNQGDTTSTNPVR